MNNLPIGIFDSGIGGLTVTKEIIKLLPNESLIYLGDTARVPYGTRGKTIITNFALELVNFLLGRQVKAIVIACNTISATCLKEIESISPAPVINVINPTVLEAIRTTKSRVIGIIGTRATVDSNIYAQQINQLDKDIKVLQVACPLFVPLAEEGFSDSPAALIVAKKYLKKIKASKVDTLILGCTHYPLLSKTIQQIVGPKVKLIDSAKPTAKKLKQLLQKKKLLSKSQPARKFYVTDAPERVYTVASWFFSDPLPGKLEKVTL